MCKVGKLMNKYEIEDKKLKELNETLGQVKAAKLVCHRNPT